LRALLSMAGMSEYSFYLSWIISTALLTTVCTAILVSVLKGGLLQKSDPALLAIMCFIHGSSLFGVSFTAASLFQNGTQSAVLATLLQMCAAISSSYV